MPVTRGKTKAATKHAAGVGQKPTIPPKALPVTLLSGFLGAGKTTLLQHILRSEHGLRIAVVVNDIGAINVDASLIKQTHRLTKTEEKVIALQNGCICCTLRGDLLEELVHLAQLQTFDYIIIESSGISEPEQVAETFDSRLAEQMELMGDTPEGLDADTIKLLQQLKRAGGLEKFARLDTTVTVIDAFTLYHDFSTSDLLSTRRTDVPAEDERTVSDLLVDQIEFADVIILNKLDLVPADTKARILALLRSLNHRASILESVRGRIDVGKIVNTGMFDMARAQTGYGWLQDLHAMTLREVNGKVAVAPRPETEEYGVGNFVYTRRRPFHPARIFGLVYDKFILQLEPFGEEGEEEEEDEEMRDGEEGESSSGTDGDGDEEMRDSGSDAMTDVTVPSSKAGSGDEEDGEVEWPDMPPNETILANKRKSALWNRLFRSKGEFFLATRPHRAGEWSQAGTMLTMLGGRPWFVTLPEEEYHTGNEEIDAMVKWDLEKGGEWGDRRQELVFIGEKLDTAGIEKALDECLLNDEEWAVWEDIMRSNGTLEEKMDKLADAFDDGFPDWFEDEEEDHSGHDHAQRPKHVITKNGVISV